jgi:penicillin-binding protein 1B
MAGAKKSPPRRKPVPARTRAKQRSRRGRTVLSSVLLLAAAAAGFYFVALWNDVTGILAERRAALSSSIYSAAHRIEVGDDLVHSRLLERLGNLAYSQVPEAESPGEYSKSAGALSIYLRAFQQGAKRYDPQLVTLRLDEGEVTAIETAEGIGAREALLEPQAIGRLVPGTAVEKVEIELDGQKPYFVDGLLATEDSMFWWHPGFNPVRIVAAAIADIRSGRLAAGASTLTQQLARTFMERRERTFERKLRELAMALVLEARLSKEKILELYINEVSLGAFEGSPIHGMPQAARYFFGKDLAQVTPAEAATLIGMVKAPTSYDPRRHVEASTERRNVVLAVMRRDDIIDDATYETSVKTPVQIVKSPGLRRAPYFTDHVIAAIDRMDGIDRSQPGIKVFTTLDTEMQEDAAAALSANLERLEKSHKSLRRSGHSPELQTAAVVLDARTGAIRAMVGGRDYGDSQFNRASSAMRQPGSAFKPVVYLAAMDPSRSPHTPVLTLASMLPNRPMTFGNWTPANYERSEVAAVTAARALSESLNIPAAYVGSKLGGDLIVKTAYELGVSQPLEPILPIAIGAEEMTLLDLTATYQVFANEGMRSPVHAIESIVDAEGNELYRYEGKGSVVVDPPVAYLMTSALKMVLKTGTGASSGRLGLDFPAAGKTGTTQDYRDAFFVGYSPGIVCGVWLGFDSPKSIGLTGAQAALPAWVQIMQDTAPAHPRDFPEPAGIVRASIDPDTGGLATPSCSRRMTLPFLPGTEPTEFCPVHADSMAIEASDTNWGGWRGAGPVARERDRDRDREPETRRPNVFTKVGKFFGSLFRRDH